LVFFARKIETGAITDHSFQFRGALNSTGEPTKPFVAMAPCGGPIGTQLIFFYINVKTYVL